MVLIIKMAFRNVFRQKRRSMFTGLTMIGGFVLLSLSISISDGTYDRLINTFTLSSTGHVQIHRQGYLDKPSLYNTVDDIGTIGKKILSVKSARAWTPRVFSGALSFIGKKTTAAQIVGIDPVREPETTHILDKIMEGRFLSKTPSKEVMIGGGLAEILRAKLGDELVLITQAADGSIANDLFTVVAILKGGTSSVDRINCYMNLDTAQDFLVLDHRIHEIAVRLASFRQARAAASQITRALDDPKLDVEPWQVVEKQFYNAMMADKEGMWLTLMIIVIIVAIGVLNTVLMTILERTREFGVIKALGTRPPTLFGLILLETAFLSLMAVGVSLILSLGLNSYMSIHGIHYPEPFEIGGFYMDSMVGTLNLRTFLLPSVVTLVTAILVSVFPAIRAMRIKPVKALSS